VLSEGKEKKEAWPKSWRIQSFLFSTLKKFCAAGTVFSYGFGGFVSKKLRSEI